MKIVHINTSDTGGGAAIACARHCEAMLSDGHDAKIFVVTKTSRKDYVPHPHWGWRLYLLPIYRVLYSKFIGKLQSMGTFSVMKYGLPFFNLNEVKNADVIFIHWVNGNALSLKGVESILNLGKPTYWYMHDMFPITGGCHHSLTCNGYKNDCVNCPIIGNTKFKKVAYNQLKQKIKHWQNYTNLEFVTPSTWLSNCVKESKIAEGHRVHIVPNLLNTDIYKPMDINAKRIFGLDPNKKTILFGAAGINSIYKGSKFAQDCLKQLNPEKYEGIVIGSANKDFIRNIPIRIIETGYLSDDISLALTYNACDTFIISSIAENYPNVVLEAMSCGKPCIGFRTGGIPDLIKHEQTGYLTNNKTAEELIKGIEWLFADENRYHILSSAAREQILENNSYLNIKHIYNEILF